MIQVQFLCGHTLTATGTEEGLRCGCGETRIDHVHARAPRFVGHALGPCAEFKNLAAEAVPLTRSTS